MAECGGTWEPGMRGHVGAGDVGAHGSRARAQRGGAGWPVSAGRSPERQTAGLEHPWVDKALNFSPARMPVSGGCVLGKLCPYLEALCLPPPPHPGPPKERSCTPLGGTYPWCVWDPKSRCHRPLTQSAGLYEAWQGVTRGRPFASVGLVSAPGGRRRPDVRKAPWPRLAPALCCGARAHRGLVTARGNEPCFGTRFPRSRLGRS